MLTPGHLSSQPQPLQGFQFLSKGLWQRDMAPSSCPSPVAFLRSPSAFCLGKAVSVLLLPGGLQHLHHLFSTTEQCEVGVSAES